MKLKKNFTDYDYVATKNFSYYYDRHQGMNIIRGQTYHIKGILKCGRKTCGNYHPGVKCGGKILLVEDNGKWPLCLYNSESNTMDLVRKEG